ncbi:MAG: hypothetical protein Q7S40_32400 [Opitutaceae bacterium]|nr:hypothetical protein [Opitutaceae bacterium]
MKISVEAAAALAAILQRNVAAIEALEMHAVRVAQDGMNREQIDSLGFTLHNLYNALENSFAQISLSFENHVKDHVGRNEAADAVASLAMRGEPGEAGIA